MFLLHTLLLELREETQT